MHTRIEVTQYLFTYFINMIASASSSKFSPYIAKSKLGQFSTRVALDYSMLSRFVYVCITFILKLVLYICILHVFIDRRVHVLSFFKQSGTRGIIPFFLYLHIVYMGILLHLRYEILRKILSLPRSISLMYFENTYYYI